jgi:hypothetical protein
MLVMLLSFIQLLRRPPPALPTAQTALASVTPAQASRTGTTAPVSATLPPTQGDAAEIIDLSPPAAGSPTAPPVTSTSPVPAANALPASASIASTGREGDQAANRARTASPPVVEAERTARTAKPSPPRTSAKREAGASQDDVALVEAMLAHAGPRKAPPAPTAQLQQCGSGSSPETAVCRAKVCVQHPSLPACHTP